MSCNMGGGVCRIANLRRMRTLPVVEALGNVQLNVSGTEVIVMGLSPRDK